MKSNGTIYAVLLASLLALPILAAGAARAQGGPDAARVEDEIRRTDEIIATAREVVGESRSNKARLRIETAVAIQEKARNAYRGSLFRAALDLTMEARTEANQAMATARLEVQAENRLGRIIEETTDRIGRVRDMAIEADIRAERPMKLIEEARSLIEKSRLNATQYRYQVAISLAENARQRVLRAEQEVRLLRSAKEMAERRLQLVERLLERSREHAAGAGDDQLERQQRLAEQQLAHARELLRDGKYRAARVAIEQCEKTVRSLTRRLGRPYPSDPQALLGEAYRLLERAEEMIGRRVEAVPYERSRQLIDQAKRLLERAEELVMQGNADEAKRLMAEIRRLLREAVGEDRGTRGGDEVSSLLEEVESLRDEATDIAGSCPAPGAVILLERAAERVETAKAHLDAGRAEAASVELRIARNIYYRIREICSSL
jgi:HEPN domain-containing protein